MNKLLCSPITKVILFLLGYIATVSFLRAGSHTFNVLFGSHFGNWFRFGSLLSVLLLLISMMLLFFSVWETKSVEKREVAFLFWRRLDASLITVFALWIASFLLFSAYLDWTDILSALILPGLAYTVFLLPLTELVARARDRELFLTLYWFRFFRLHPIWSPLGLLFFLLLLGSLALLFFLSPAAGAWLGFFPQTGIALILSPGDTSSTRWWIDLVNVLRAFSALTLIASTYFAAFLLNLSSKYDLANAEKIRAERLKSELITNVSHDIRTPLTSLINYVDLLNKLPLQGEAAAYVSVLDQKSTRLKMLIDDLMEASKAGTGNVKIELQTVNLSEIVGQAAGEFEEELKERKLTLVFHQPEGAIFVSADSRHLWRVLENLFSNAAKYACPGTRIFVRIDLTREGKPLFALQNTSEAPLDTAGEALTEQFIRGDRARYSEGSGLGLYIAKNLVELMGGQFTIRTKGDLFEAEIVFEASSEK